MGEDVPQKNPYPLTYSQQWRTEGTIIIADSHSLSALIRIYQKTMAIWPSSSGSLCLMPLHCLYTAP